MLNKTLTGLFATRSAADAAIEELKMQGISSNDVSVLAQETTVDTKVTKSATDKMAEGAGSGGVTGAAVGGLVGLLVGVGALAIPGIGALFIAGPIAAALGLTGAAATTVGGALSGALAGGLLGGLMGLGFSKDDAELYERRIKAGDILVAVSVHDATSADGVQKILANNGAQEVRTLHEAVAA